MRLTAAQIYVVVLLALTALAAVAYLAPLARPVAASDGPTLAVTLEEVPVSPQRSRVLGYERVEFGSGWSQAGACSVRDHIMAAHFTAIAADECEVHGTATDPYTGTPMAATDVEIDHIFPLSAAWDLGAAQWTLAARQAFANDPINLVATSRAANQDKSDQLPAAWLPPDPSSRCWYVRRLAMVAASYRLALPMEDIGVMRRQCALRTLIDGLIRQSP